MSAGNTVETPIVVDSDTQTSSDWEGESEARPSASTSTSSEWEEEEHTRGPNAPPARPSARSRARTTDSTKTERPRIPCSKCNKMISKTNISKHRCRQAREVKSAKDRVRESYHRHHATNVIKKKECAARRSYAKYLEQLEIIDSFRRPLPPRPSVDLYVYDSNIDPNRQSDPFYALLTQPEVIPQVLKLIEERQPWPTAPKKCCHKLSLCFHPDKAEQIFPKVQHETMGEFSRSLFVNIFKAPPEELPSRIEEFFKSRQKIEDYYPEYEQWRLQCKEIEEENDKHVQQIRETKLSRFKRFLHCKSYEEFRDIYMKGVQKNT